MLDHWKPTHELLKQRIALVTGAGSGIGRAVARAYAAHGATVILADKGIPELETLYDEIQSAGGPQPAIYPINLEGAVDKDYRDLAETIEREFKKLDILLHNAAWLSGLTSLANFNTETWHKTFQINLHAPFIMTRELLGLLAKSDDASVIFCSDQVGRHGRAYWGAYAASKAGLESLSQVLADELETNTSIRVNSIDPGPVYSRLRSAAYPAEDKSGLAQAEEITDTFIYLASTESKGLTGQALVARKQNPHDPLSPNRPSS